MPVKKHTYTQDGVTVLWQPHLCIHAGNCVRGLPAVFNPRLTPWVNMEAAPADRIAEQVRLCPSGALSLLSAPDQSFQEE